MARRTVTVTIPTSDPGNRDAGRTYLVTEMSAADAEAWAVRALLALTNSGAQLADIDPQNGMAGVYAAGMDALLKLDYATVKPLMDDMWGCVKYQHPPHNQLHDPDPYVDEVSTRLELRKAILTLHTGFLKAGSIPTAG